VKVERAVHPMTAEVVVVVEVVVEVVHYWGHCYSMLGAAEAAAVVRRQARAHCYPEVVVAAGAALSLRVVVVVEEEEEAHGTRWAVRTHQTGHQTQTRMRRWEGEGVVVEQTRPPPPPRRLEGDAGQSHGPDLPQDAAHERLVA
jgi:hypothetical protein